MKEEAEKENLKILKYISEEKDISKYKLSTLGSKSDSAARNRLIAIEKEFINLQLEDMGFTSLADAATAIKIYRTSRGLFYKTYKISVDEPTAFDRDALIYNIKKRVEFLETQAHACTHRHTQKLNLAEDSDLYSELLIKHSIRNSSSIKDESEKFKKLGFNELFKMEPLTLMKKRARAQVATHSIGLYLSNEVDRIKNFDMPKTYEGFQSISDDIDSIIENLDNNIYKNYNNSIELLPSSISGTIGDNEYIPKLHSLGNVLKRSSFSNSSMPEPNSKSTSFCKTRPVIGNVLYGLKNAVISNPKTDSDRNIKNKVFGILLPIPRKGNEKMTVLHREIYVDGVNISHLFSDSFSNIIAIKNNKSIYYKAIMMMPIWHLIKMSSTDLPSRVILSKIASFDYNNFENINFNSQYMINKINDNFNLFIDVSQDSKVLAAKTRSEEEGIADIGEIVNYRVSKIKEDYSKIVTTNEIF